MKHLMREYGAIVLVIGVAMIGYLVYQQNRADILTYTLDVLGARLVELVDDEDKKASVRNRFAEIKARVLDKEVDPAEVEALAANVLNLSAAGSRLTADEANVMIDLTVTPDNASAAANDPTVKALRNMAFPQRLDARPPRVTAAAYQALGKNLRRALETESELLALAPTAPTGSSGASPGAFFSFNANDGLHVMVDSTFAGVVVQARGPEGLRELEREHAVVWHHNIMKEQMEAQKRARVELDTIPSSYQNDEVHRSTVRALRILRGLEAKGLIFSASSDTVRAKIWDAIRAENALRVTGAATEVPATQSQ